MPLLLAPRGVLGLMLDFNQALTQGQLDEIMRRRTVDADDVRTRLHDDAEGFVKWLFSGRALIARGEARIGDVYGAPGGSLSVSLRGASAGLWHDHATGESGDLIGLYMAYMGYGQPQFGTALKEIANEFLGDVVEVPRAPWEESAARRIERKAKELGTRPRQDMVELGPKVADWKYRDLHGNVIASVARYEPDGPESKTYRPFCFKEEDGKKVWRMGAPTLRPLYRLPEIVTCRTVVLVEGEKCAQALAEIGVDATTAMQGAEAPIEKTDWSPIIGKHVIIWPDNDRPGFDYADRVAAHLKAIGCTVSLVKVPDGKPEKWDAADCIEEGSDARAVIATATEPVIKPKFQIYSWQDLDTLPPPRWHVKGFVPEGGFVGIYGPSGHNKSFVGVDLASCIATGAEWHGYEVTQTPVLYIIGEGQRGIRKRLQAWQQARKAICSLYVLPVAPTFPDDLQALETAIAAMPERPGLIILDTLARTFKGNENDAEDMGTWIRSATWLQSRFDATVIFVHHTGKDVDKKDRGHSSLRAAADTMIRVQKKGEHGVTVLVDKQKDDEELTLELRSVVTTIGKDEETDAPITSLILTLDDGPPVQPQAKTERETPSSEQQGNAKLILDALISHGPLGTTRLELMTGINRGTVHKALKKLEAENAAAQNAAGHWYAVL